MFIEGQHLGEFEVIEHLGQGGMGAVFKARQTSLHRLVALKTLQPFLSDDDEYIARFKLLLEELRVLWRLVNERGWISRQQLVFVQSE